MSAVIDCSCAPCSTVAAPVQVPGVNGANAQSLVQADFTVPAVNSSVTVTVDNTGWMVIGQSVVVGQTIGVAIANPGPASFRVASIPSATTVSLTYLGLPGDVSAASTISKGAAISPGNSGVLFQAGTTANMVGGTVAVTGVRLTTSSRILMSVNTVGGTPGNLKTTARTPGAAGSFNIVSSSGSETSTVDYLIVG